MSLRDSLVGAVILIPAYLIPSRATDWYKLPVTVIVALNTIFLVAIWQITTILRLLIRRTSDPRREAIRRKIGRDVEAVKANRRESPKSEDSDWEKVAGNADTLHATQSGKTSDYDGFIGFFHPFANAGGGGERVLWAAVKATQDKHPRAICVIYTGDSSSNKDQILKRVKSRFDIELNELTVLFLYLEKRDWVVASSFPRFTLLAQSIGSMFVAHEALSLVVPDIFIDTMGYAFSSWYCKLLFPRVVTGSYVHYPFIGTHMIDSLGSESAQGVNAGSGQGPKGTGKRVYWNLLLQLYQKSGLAIDTVMTNSSWTQDQMNRIWGPDRKTRNKSPPQVVYPPCSVEHIVDQVPLEETPREKILLCIAQFRPEKNHEMLIQAFASVPDLDAKLVLVGSVRDTTDETLVYKLRLLAKELKVEDRVEFRIDISWSEIIDWLKKSSVGVNGMWCEHFGIGVVEYQAAGLICVVNDSGGPKQDIVVDYSGGPTGFLASTEPEYASAFQKSLNLSATEERAMRQRNRESSWRFATKNFAEAWTDRMDAMTALALSNRR